jgi:YidC/Oxa1 family membrane protein insertase
VSIEMRHESFLWISDLSLPDPTSLFNLFGLLPFAVPAFLKIGILPILMGISMFLQQKFNPKATDPMQEKVMKLMPVIFTFMFYRFPAGLVLYWVWNNVLSILQQIYIQKSLVKETERF